MAPLPLVSLLVFVSGWCALVYQIAWTRDFRLIFGSSTPAAAAVVAVFVGGLGLGGWLLGRRAERHRRPLALYAHLELGIALSTALTPALLALARRAYFAVGGTVALGMTFGSIARLVLTALVLGVPTFLMGGTLPALARAVETDDDPHRRGVAVLYGVNTLGAVVGCMLTNFVLLERVGTHTTLWIAAGTNLVLALVARLVAALVARPVAADDQTEAQRSSSTSAEAASSPDEAKAGQSVDAKNDAVPVAVATVSAVATVPAAAVTAPAAAPVGFTLFAAAAVGFAFFLMELVWYRMLGPLLGGTVFTFGLILGVALLGIGIGGALYPVLFPRGRSYGVGPFTLTCLLEAALIAAPFALGDRLAVAAAMLRSLGAAGFMGFVTSWTLVAAIVVLPAAIVSGVQFPLLIALLGRGRRGVGRDVGMVYAWNTVGAIVGSLAGGFGLMPLLTAPGCWRLVVIMLVLVGVVAAFVALRQGGLRRPVFQIVLGMMAVLMTAADGPTAAWRHSGIVVGRFSSATFGTPNRIEMFLRDARWRTLWQKEGVESSVAITTGHGISFWVNGKSDGNARLDAGTQIMCGMIPATLHPAPRSAMVVGLGTGSTAGWLGSVPTMERVDVAELEPAILEMARRSAAVNQHVLENPKVHVQIGDARELVMVSRQRYDIIASEPSNPYRAGIASLYTREFYQSVRDHLAEGGLFAQWVQVYEVDAQTVRTIIATLAGVFPEVETWQTSGGDLLLVASSRPMVKEAGVLRARLAQPPFRDAVQNAWNQQGLEGFLSHFIARSSLSRAIAELEQGFVNTDDVSPVEFGFAHNMGLQNNFSLISVMDVANSRGEDRPEVVGGDVDWPLVRYETVLLAIDSGVEPRMVRELSDDARRRVAAVRAFGSGNMDLAVSLWRATPRQAQTQLEMEVAAHVAVLAGAPEAEELIAALRSVRPTEADALTVARAVRQNKLDDATSAYLSMTDRLRQDPWPLVPTIAEALKWVAIIANGDGNRAMQLMKSLAQPFAVRIMDDQRYEALRAMSGRVLRLGACDQVLKPFEPHAIWTEEVLLMRAACYESRNDPMFPQARADIEAFRANQPPDFGAGLRVAAKSAAPAAGAADSPANGSGAPGGFWPAPAGAANGQ